MTSLANGSMIIKTGTVYSRKFSMVLNTDHVSPATGKTVTVKISKGPGAAGVTAAGTVTELDSTNVPGIYQISYTAVDTNTSGDLAAVATATGCDNSTWVDQVQAQVFTDLSLTATGRQLISDNIQQNQPLNGFTFLMVNSSTGQPATGLTITAQRSLGGAGFAACANSVSEVGNGIYSINLAAADLNSPTVMLRFTAATASDLDILLVTTP